MQSLKLSTKQVIILCLSVTFSVVLVKNHQIFSPLLNEREKNDERILQVDNGPDHVLLNEREILMSNTHKTVPNLNIQLKHERDGNLVLCSGTNGVCGTVLWESGYHGSHPSYSTLLQRNGRLATRYDGDHVWKAREKGSIDSTGSYQFAVNSDVSEIFVQFVPLDDKKSATRLWMDRISTSQIIAPTPSLPIDVKTTNPTATMAITTDGTNNPIMLLAYYYPWYIRNDWSRHGYQDEPLLGKYGTDEVAVAEQHNEWAFRAGIDAWVVSWNSDSSLRAKHFRKGMLQSNNMHKMKYMMLYESLNAFPTRDFLDGTRALDVLIADMKSIRDEHFDNPSYLYINDRPVIGLYVTRTWVNFQPSMVETIKRELKHDVLFIADEPFFGDQATPAKARNGIRNNQPVFETYTAYNMYTDPLIEKGQTAVDYMFRHGLDIYENWSKEVVFFPKVLPQYHDFRPGHLPLVGDAEGLRAQLDKFACLPRPSGYVEGTFPEMIFVTSFNEWWEGSQVEPDDSNKYGFTFIDELKKFKDDGKKCSR